MYTNRRAFLRAGGIAPAAALPLTQAERDNLRRFADHGGLLFSDDCNHDVNGLYAKSFEQEMHAAFPADPLAKLPLSHPIYTSFFTFRDGPPQTSHELNGWGDNIVHGYLEGTERRGRLGVLRCRRSTAAAGQGAFTERLRHATRRPCFRVRNRLKEFAMGRFGIPELMILVVIAGVWLVPVAAGIWAVVTLHRLRVGQLEVLTKLARIERHLPQI